MHCGPTVAIQIVTTNQIDGNICKLARQSFDPQYSIAIIYEIRSKRGSDIFCISIFRHHYVFGVKRILSKVCAHFHQRQQYDNTVFGSGHIYQMFILIHTSEQHFTNTWHHFNITSWKVYWVFIYTAMIKALACYDAHNSKGQKGNPFLHIYFYNGFQPFHRWSKHHLAVAAWKPISSFPSEQCCLRSSNNPWRAF